MSSSAPVRKPTGEFNDLEHSWVPTKGHATSAADYADLAAKKDEAERRRAEREARSALEAREAEVERRERAIKLKQEEKEKAEAYRRQLADQDMKRRAEKERERLEKERKKNQPKRPPFDYAREKPQIQLAIANASSAAIALVNACRVGLDIRHPICLRSRLPLSCSPARQPTTRVYAGEPQGSGCSRGMQGRSKTHHPLHPGKTGNVRQQQTQAEG
jgi:hypothetical protein